MHFQSLPLVSIVTPAYNEEENLSECIESVLAQTYSNWDFTIVNNASTDGTLAIAQKYAAIDPRIHVITNDTLIPALANINKAFRQIAPTSNYCKMILADDWMFPECLERMVAMMEEHPSTGIVGAYSLKEQWILWMGLPYSSHVVPGREICRQRLLGGPYVFGSPSSVLFRSDLVRSHDPFYNESNMQADSEACFELLKESDFGFVHQVLTFSRSHRPGSLSLASLELNTMAAGMLHELVAYGPYYLTPQEYANCLKADLDSYYDFLATSFFERRPREFWDFHKLKLKEEGIEFSRTRLAHVVSRRILRRLYPARIKPNTRQWGLSAIDRIPC
jgi:glycosyltransferase involved in cell wall biosynthesis